jgi:4-aminobutyrate aminotransferase-like enzyme
MHVLLLRKVLFVNSGSEANDLAWRCAKAYTGHTGALCTKHGYHGATMATVALSPETAGAAGHLPHHVERFEAPDALRKKHLDPHASFADARRKLEEKGHRLAMTILDGVSIFEQAYYMTLIVTFTYTRNLNLQVLQSDGVLVAEPSWARALCAATRAAGGLWCADEVQGGHGRTGSHLWSFQRLGLVPDIVTLGKSRALALKRLAHV